MNRNNIETVNIKQLNRQKVYQFIYHQKQTSKQELVQNLGLGLSTVSQNLTQLEQDGLIERTGAFQSTGGRKAQIIQIVPEFKIAIGVGILKNMLHLVSVNLYGEVLGTETIPLKYTESSEYYHTAAESIVKFIHSNGYYPEQILGISIATQGIISPDGTSVTYSAVMNNASMKLYDFADRLPYPCRLEHDSKSAAYLELWSHPDLDSALVFLLNRNLGGAVITHHHVHQGLSFHSGCLEHICIDPAGPLCYCGNHGCLETYCSANSLEAASGMNIKDFFSELENSENQKVNSIWNHYLEHLAFAIRNLNMMFDSPVIISGYLAPYFTDEILDKLLLLINSATPFPLERKNLMAGSHGQYTPAIGAALHYVNHFLKSEI